jgi:hypothetical protein
MEDPSQGPVVATARSRGEFDTARWNTARRCPEAAHRQRRLSGRTRHQAVRPIVELIGGHHRSGGGSPASRLQEEHKIAAVLCRQIFLQQAREEGVCQIAEVVANQHPVESR